jgi:hypothetical protein
MRCSRQPRKRIYQLIPAEFSHDNVAIGKLVDGVWYTRDEEEFWRRP